MGRSEIPAPPPDSDAITLALSLAERDRRRFSGRTDELAFLERHLTGEDRVAVVFVHGPGGIGKSTLLREFERRAVERGYEPFFLEGRDLPPGADELEALISAARRSSRPLVLIDTYERMRGLDTYLRRDLLPTLPASSAVVIAGRTEPDPAWFAGIWEGAARELALGPVPREDALAMVAAHGLRDDRSSAIVDWAQGSPLALALAAETGTMDASWTPAVGPARPEILRALIRRLVESELQDRRPSALSVAAIARVTTADLLGAVYPGADAGLEFEQLSALSFTEPLGDGVTLHELVRMALLEDLRHRDPERERDLRRRIVDHLYRRARSGHELAIIELAHLVENPTIRWGFSWDGSLVHRSDRVRAGDADAIGAIAAERGFADWWQLTLPFFERAPSCVAIARDLQERIGGYTVSMSLATAPEFAYGDPLVGPWLDHAREQSRDGDSVLWHDSVELAREPGARVQAMLGIVGILRSGVANPRYAYMPINPDVRGALSFSRAMNAEHLQELDIQLGAIRIECHRIDYGPGGLIAALRRVVYRELGLPPPAEPDDLRVDVEAVRDALRSFNVPSKLAQSPLAGPGTVQERAESVRRRLIEAAEVAFGTSESEQLLRRVLVLGYLHPAQNHARAALDLSMSRASYFRRLKLASERLAEQLSAGAD